ncbi:MAG TPA: hypothetical protein VLL57_00665, partial [Candidatus Binataceae bacterium]|nr:hypothetical protein [Candidatus Binataceae bacterium]
MEAANQSFGPVLILLALISAFLYLHFTNGSGLTRLYLAAVLTVVALLLLVPSVYPDMPDAWKSWMPASKIELGLDLQGGTHLLMAVKLDDAVATQLRRRGDDIKKELKDNKLDFDQITQDPKSGALLVALKGADERSVFTDLMQKSFPDLAISSATLPNAAGPVYALSFRPRDVTQIRNNAMDQALETIRNRIDQLGVRETTVAREGENEILIQLPGIQDPQRAKELIG